MRFFLLGLIMFLLMPLFSQEVGAALPYHKIPEYPENYGAGNVLSRLIDGLGYRYYWATKDLRVEDLAY